MRKHEVFPSAYYNAKAVAEGPILLTIDFVRMESVGEGTNQSDTLVGHFKEQNSKLSDELASLFLNMSRYSGGQDNEFWLEAWNGGSYTVERMGRPPIVVDYLLVGVVGGLAARQISSII